MFKINKIIFNSLMSLKEFCFLIKNHQLKIAWFLNLKKIFFAIRKEIYERALKILANQTNSYLQFFFDC